MSEILTTNRNKANKTTTPSIYDDQTDINKIGSGAIAGITTGNGNIAIDAATSGLTGLTMKSSAIKKNPDSKAKTTPTQAGEKTRL